MKEIPCGHSRSFNFCLTDRKVVRMFVLISRMGSNLGDLESKSRSLGQIKELPCGRSRGHISCSIDLKIGRNVCLDEISDHLNLDHLGSKTRSFGHLKETFFFDTL